MKSHEFIQAAADMLSAFGGAANNTNPSADITVAGKLQAVEPEYNDNTETTTMVGPLQQKLELLKKAVDVDNMYDNPQTPGHGNSQVTGGDDNEITDMKRLAGIMFGAEEDTDGLEG